MSNTTENLLAFQRGNLEAFMKSGQIWAAGVQELTRQFAATAKASFEESGAALKSLSTVKSMREAIDLQSGFSRTAFDKAMAEAKQMTDTSLKLSERALAPLTARVTVAVETFGKAA